MNTFTRIALPIVLSMTAAAAMAGEIAPEAPFVSKLTRAEVQAQANMALDAGLIASGDFTPVLVSGNTSNVTRAQVQADAAQAQRLGLVVSGNTLAQGQNQPVMN